MADAVATVFIVDDDASTRDSLRWLIESVGLSCETFASATEFLGVFDASRPGCLVLDVRMPGMSGLELQEELVARGAQLPAIMITGYADVPMAVRAMKAGVLEFIEKPFSEQVLLDRIHHAIKQDKAMRDAAAALALLQERFTQLTPRERQVMTGVVAGKPSREIATDLGLSQKTIEVHRGRIMEKAQAKSVAELVRLTLTADLA
ncbi:MAG: response regulator transcription factor [Myxococcales bacterium]|nr:response regulator transcription factor [Myxococcales bacterium]